MKKYDRRTSEPYSMLDGACGLVLPGTPDAMDRFETSVMTFANGDGFSQDPLVRSMQLTSLYQLSQRPDNFEDALR